MKRMAPIFKFIKNAVSALGHIFLWTKPGERVSLQRALIAACGYGFACALWTLTGTRDHENLKLLAEIAFYAFTAMSAFEIADGVILPRMHVETLEKGGDGATAIVPSLLLDASRKCQVGLVFATYAWLADMAGRYLI